MTLHVSFSELKAFTQNLTERMREKERVKERAREKDKEKKIQPKKKKLNDERSRVKSGAAPYVHKQVKTL